MAIGQAVNAVINKKTEVRAAVRNFTIYETTPSRLLTEFEEQEFPTDFVYAARNYVKGTFSTSQKVYLVRYFKQAAKLRYVVIMKWALKIAFQYRKKYGVVMPENLVKNKYAANMWFRGLRKCHEPLSLRKPKDTCESFSCEM